MTASQVQKILFLLALIIKVFVQAEDLQKSEAECPRYCLQEIREAFFNKVYEEEMQWLHDTYYDAQNGVALLMHSIRSAEGEEETKALDDLKKELINLRSKESEFFKIDKTLNQRWDELIKNVDLVDEMTYVRNNVTELHNELRMMNKRLYDPFDELADVCKMAIRPMVAVFQKIMGSTGSQAEKEMLREVLLRKVEEKSKLLGKVLRRTLDYIKNDEEPDAPYFLYYTISWYEEFAVSYHTTMNKSPKGFEDWYKVAFEQLSKFNTDMFCEEFEGSVQECHEEEKVNLLASVFYHSEWSDDRKLPDI